jgi:hypothetical protein
MQAIQQRTSSAFPSIGSEAYRTSPVCRKQCCSSVAATAFDSWLVLYAALSSTQCKCSPLSGGEAKLPYALRRQQQLFHMRLHRNSVCDGRSPTRVLQALCQKSNPKSGGGNRNVRSTTTLCPHDEDKDAQEGGAVGAGQVAHSGRQHVQRRRRCGVGSSSRPSSSSSAAFTATPLMLYSAVRAVSAFRPGPHFPVLFALSSARFVLPSLSHATILFECFKRHTRLQNQN